MAKSYVELLEVFLESEHVDKALGDFAKNGELNEILLNIAHSIRKITKSGNSNLVFMNPASITTPQHPGNLATHSLKSCWNDTLSFSRFFPIAINEKQQAQLITAFSMVNSPNIPVSHHVSASIIKSLGTYKDGCFIAKYNSTDKNITVKHCGNGGHSTIATQLETFPASHYDYLFSTLGVTTILFRPHPLLCALRKDDPLYSQYLVGSYLCFSDVDSNDDSCACAEVATQVCDWSDILSAIMYRKSRLNAHIQLDLEIRKQFKLIEDQLTQIKKYQSMYSQLLTPLRSLTDAVRKTQADAHQIITTIYDPLDVLLECQPEIAQLFQPGSSVTVPSGRRVKVKHEPKEYIACPNDGIGIATEAFHRLRNGATPKWTKKTGKDDSSAFKEELLNYSKYARNEENYLYTFSNALSRFIGLGTWTTLLRQLDAQTITYSQLAIDILSSLKLKFFSLYKPDKANDALSWGVLGAYLATIEGALENGSIKCELKFNCECSNEQKNKLPVLLEGTNPFSIHGHVIEFIGRVVAQHYSYWANIKEETPQFTFELELTESKASTISEDENCYDNSKLIIKSNQIWMDDHNDFAAFLAEQIQFKKKGVRSVEEFGDRKRPFVKLLERVPIELINNTSAKATENDVMTLKMGHSFQIQFSGCDFIIISQRNIVPK